MEEKKEIEVKKDLKQQSEKAAKAKKTETQKTTTKKNITANKATTGTKKTTTKKAGRNIAVEKLNEEKVVSKVNENKETKVEKPEIKEDVNKNTANEIDAMEKELKQVEEELQSIEREDKITIKKENEKPKFELAKKAEPKKKKHRILKIILILIVVGLILFLINYVRNYYIIHDLVEKQAKLLDCTNYSFEVQYYSSNNENNKDILKHYYKDDKSMLIKEGEETVIIWNDAETKETIFITPQELKARVQQNSGIGLTANLVSQNLKDIEVWSFIFLISTEVVDGQECYKIRCADSMTLWVNKENGLIVKSINGKTVINGKEYDSISERKNIKMNELTDIDMSRPNLMGYNVEITE